MATTAAGLIDALDGYVHAARPGVIRAMSVCGAGPLVVELTGSFDPTDPLACPRCTARVAPPLDVTEPSPREEPRSA